MTGVEFSAIIDLKIDKAYSAFLTPIEKNRIIKESTIKTILQKYSVLDDQGERDQIISFIRTNAVFTPVNNQIYTVNVGSPFISDYGDLFSVKAKFVKQIYGLSITSATNTAPIVCTILGANNLRTGEQIEISGVVGNFAANGTFYIKKIKSNQIALYSDISLQNAVAGNGVYGNGGILKNVFYNYCLPIVSDKKIDPYSKSTLRIPRFEIADKAIKIYPLTETCTEIMLDYLSYPTLFIDVTDSSTDIELTYPIDLLYDIADNTSNLFAQAFKDMELFNTSNFELKKNE